MANREDSMEILPPVESPSQSAAGDKTHPEITWAGEGDEEGSVRPAGKERRSNLGGGFTDTRSERLPSAHRDSKKQQSQLSTEGDKGPAVVAAPQEPPLAPYVARRAAGAGAVRQGQGRRGESALAPVNTPARAGAGEAGEEGPVGAESVLPVVGGPTSSAGEREGGESGEDREGGSAVPAGVARLREEGRGGYSSARSSVQEGR